MHLFIAYGARVLSSKLCLLFQWRWFAIDATNHGDIAEKRKRPLPKRIGQRRYQKRGRYYPKPLRNRQREREGRGTVDCKGCLQARIGYAQQSSAVRWTEKHYTRLGCRFPDLNSIRPQYQTDRPNRRFHHGTGFVCCYCQYRRGRCWSFKDEGHAISRWTASRGCVSIGSRDDTACSDMKSKRTTITVRKLLTGSYG